MKKPDKKTLLLCIFSLLFSLTYIVLGCIPNGIQMDFFGGYVSHYPYFSAMPYGYGNVFPILIEILAIVNVILLVISIFLPKKGFDITRIVLPSIILVFNLAELFFTTTVTAINIAMFDVAFAHVAYEAVIAIFKKYTAEKPEPFPTYQEFCEMYNLDSTSTPAQLPDDFEDDY